MCEIDLFGPQAFKLAGILLYCHQVTVNNQQYQIEAQQTVNTQPKEITYIGQTVHHSDGRVLEPRCQGHHCS